MRAITRRLERLEAAARSGREGLGWLAVRQWLGESLSAGELERLATYRAMKPPYDPAAPIDTRGWSRAARELMGCHGPASQFHVPDLVK